MDGLRGKLPQYYQMDLNLCPLPWQKFVSDDYCAQFRHKLPPPEPGWASFKLLVSHKLRPEPLRGTDPNMTWLTPGLLWLRSSSWWRRLKISVRWTGLEHIHKDIIQKLEALKHGMDVQEVTLTRLFSMLRWQWKARTGQRWEGYRHTDQTTARRFLFSTSEYQKLVEKDRQQTEAAEAAATKKKLEDEKKERRKEKAAARQERAQRKREREKAEKAARKQRRRDRHKKARGATDGELRCPHTVQSMAQRASP